MMLRGTMMPNDLEQTIAFTLMSVKEMLDICPEQFMLSLINQYPDVLEKIEAEIANIQVQEYLRNYQECD